MNRSARSGCDERRIPTSFNSCRDGKGQPLSLNWDGKNAHGAYVASGSYTLLLEKDGGRVFSRGFTVLRSPESDPLEGVLILGSPYRGTAPLRLRFAAPLPAALELRLYNLAGELAGSWGSPAGAMELSLDPKLLAAGIYLASLDLKAPVPQRRTLKVAIIQ
jgi:hypothetical protein